MYYSQSLLSFIYIPYLRPNIPIFNVKMYQVEFLIFSHHVTPNVMCRVVRVYIATAGSTDNARHYTLPDLAPAQLSSKLTNPQGNKTLPIPTAARAEGRPGGPDKKVLTPSCSLARGAPWTTSSISLLPTAILFCVSVRGTLVRFRISGD